MPIEPLDILLLVVMLISALLAMVRGFMREIFSIISWAAAAACTLYFYKRLVPVAKQYIYNDLIATGAVVGILFLGTLLVVSIITIKISDAILDSRVGALDRTLGFLFGLARGLIVVVAAYTFFARDPGPERWFWDLSWGDTVRWLPSPFKPTLQSATTSALTSLTTAATRSRANAISTPSRFRIPAAATPMALPPPRHPAHLRTSTTMVAVTSQRSVRGRSHSVARSR